jgi:hypothetical protein
MPRLEVILAGDRERYENTSCQSMLIKLRLYEDKIENSEYVRSYIN